MIFIAIKIIAWLTRCVSVWVIVLIIVLLALLGWLAVTEKSRYHKVDTGTKLPKVSKTQAAAAVAQRDREQDEEKKEHYEWAAKNKESGLLESLENVVDHLEKNRKIWFTQQDILAVKGLRKKGDEKRIKDLFDFYEEIGGTTGANPNIKWRDNNGELQIRYV